MANNVDPDPVKQENALNVEILSLIDVSCFGLLDGAVTVNATGGLPPYTYVWSNGMVGPILLGLSAGVYTVTATDLLGATGELTVTIDEPLELNVDLLEQVNIDCGDPSGSISVGGTGGTGPYLYLWSNGSLSPTLTDLSAGIYIVTLTDENLCIDIQAFEVTADITLPAVNATVDVEINCLEPEVILDGTGSAVGANIAYLWTTVDGHILSGENTLNPVVDSAGTYTLTVTNLLNECTASENVLVEADITLPTVTIASGGGVDLQIDCETPTITLDGTGSAVGADILYLWSTVNGNIVSGANTLNPVVDAAGEYSLLITNAANGCENSDEVTVTADLDLPLVNIETGLGVDLQLDCISPEITLSGEGSVTGPNISYLWTTVDGNIVSGATTLHPVVNAAGEYTLTVLDLLNSCTASASVDVTVNISLPTANVESGPGIDLQIDCITTDITLSGLGSSIGDSILYLWTTLDGNIVAGIDGLEAVVDAAGTYTLLVTNENSGCTASDDVIVTVDVDLPIANAGASVEIDCANPIVTLNGNGSSQGGNFSYLWTTVDGNIVSGANTLSPEVNAAGIYLLTVTNEDNGCTATSSVLVTVSLDLPIVDIEIGAGVDLQIDCLTPEITLDATASATGLDFIYLWTTVDGNIVSGENTLTPVVNAAGTYTLTVTNTATGCSATAAVTVTVDLDLPAVNIETGVDLQIDCLSPSITLNGSGSYAGPGAIYLWTTVDGNIVAGANTLMATVDAAGEYTLTVLNSLNGCEASATVTVTISLDEPDIVIQAPGELGCANSAITLNASGSSSGPGYTYLWTTSNGHIVSGANTLMATVDAAGEYTLTITAPNGCSAEETVTVEGTPAIGVAISNMVNVDCFGGLTGSVTVEATAGTAPFSYAWSNGANTAMISGVGAGVYTVTVGDANGCSAVVQVEIQQPDDLEVSTSATAVTQAGASDGTATATPTGGVAPYTYLWSNGMTTATITGLSAGVYTVVVTDANGCTEEVEVTVPDFDGCLLSVTVTGVDSDCGMSNGTAAAVVSGGTGTVTYAWSNGMNTANLSGLAGGTYTVTVSDGDGCTATGSVVITENDDLAPTVVTQDITVYLDENGTVTITTDMVNNGSADDCGNITITIDVTDFDCDDLGPNTVNVTVTDASGNTATGTAVVTVVDNLPPVATCPDNMTIDDCSGIVDYDLPTLTDNCASVSMSNTILISGFASGEVFPLGTTTVSYAVISTTGEISTCEFDVSVTGALDVAVDVTSPSCAGMADGTATAVVSGGSGNYTYFWLKTNGQTTQTAVGLAAGDYGLVVADDQGCAALYEFTVTNPEPIVLSLILVTDVCGDELGSIDITVGGGSGGYTFVWYDANGNIVGTTEDLTNVPAGEYTVVITDSNGCTFTSGEVVVDFFNDVVELLPAGTEIGVFPNPTASGIVTLSVDLVQESKVSVELYDMASQNVGTVVPEQLRSSFDQQIDLSSYPGGSYLLKVFADGIPTTTKLIYMK